MSSFSPTVDFLLGFMLYQALLFIILAGVTIWVTMSFITLRNSVVKAMNLLFDQDKELYDRLRQIQSLFTMFDALMGGSNTTGSSASGATKGNLTNKKQNPFVFGKSDRNHPFHVVKEDDKKPEESDKPTV